MGFIRTYTGRKIDPYNVKASDIDIRDIARGLSMQCRWGGQVDKFYSVAEHSVLVASGVYALGGGAKAAFDGLMHDAPEAYISDIIRPLKKNLPQYEIMELDFARAIDERYGCSVAILSDIVREVDDMLLTIEACALLQASVIQQQDWEIPRKVPKIQFGIHGYDPKDAERMFIEHFDRIKVNF